MNTQVSKIKNAIKQLPVKDIRQLCLWLQDYVDNIWDKQIEKELKAENLDNIIAQPQAHITIVCALKREQKALVPVYQTKWHDIAFSTERINRQKAEDAIKNFYQALEKPEPKIVFYDSSLAALKQIPSDVGNSINGEIIKYELSLNRELGYPIIYYDLNPANLKTNLDPNLRDEIWRTTKNIYSSPSQLYRLQLVEERKDLDIGINVSQSNISPLEPEQMAYYSGYFDFCFSVIKLGQSIIEKWHIWEKLSSECGWIIPYENTCLICDRPIKILLDNKGYIHADNKPAIDFSDGFCVYAYHGRIIPKKYSHFHPNDWQTEWIFNLIAEENTELLEILILESEQEIYRKLNAFVIDIEETSEEISKLLKINLEVNTKQLKILVIHEFSTFVCCYMNGLKIEEKLELNGR